MPTPEQILKPFESGTFHFPDGTSYAHNGDAWEKFNGCADALPTRNRSDTAKTQDGASVQPELF